MESFARFMTRALYHPEQGYYMQERDPIGRDGDFYTAPRLHPWFGALLGQQVARQWRAWGRPAPFYLLEWGCGDGQLALDLLNWLRQVEPECYASMQVWLLDISPVQRQRARTRLKEAGHGRTTQVRRYPPAGPLPFAAGIAYEFLDALPVHLLCWDGRKWREGYFSDEGQLLWEKLSRPQLLAELKNWQIWPRLDQKIEVCLAGKSWLRRLRSRIEHGYLLLIDYGYEEWQLAHHPEGTLRAYRHHQVKGVDWQAAGQEDITAGVNFSALCRWCQELGCQVSQPAPLSRWLLQHGLAAWLLEQQPVLEERLRLKHFFCPGGIGEKFSVVEASWPLG